MSRPQLNTRSVQPFDKDVGNTIRTHRNRVGLSQEELGRELGVTFQQIQKYEKGNNRLSLRRAVQVCDLFEIPLDELAGVNGTGKKLSRAAEPIDFKTLGKLSELEPRVKLIVLNIASLLDRQVKKRK